MPGWLTLPPRRRTWAWGGAGLTAYVVLGALAGAVWLGVYSPPEGQVFDGEFYLLSASTRVFAGTGWFIVICGVVGLVLGTSTAWYARRYEPVVLTSSLLGCLLLEGVAALVGRLGGPPDPVAAARDLGDGTMIPVMVEVGAAPAWLAAPFGFLVGFVAVFLSGWRPPPRPGRRQPTG